MLAYQADLDLLISQWASSPNLQRVLTIFSEVMTDEILDPLNKIHGSRTIDSAAGVFLDFIGQLMGLRRPTLRSSQHTDTFGFDDAGEAFGRARMRDLEELEPVAPISDLLYRRLLKARAIALLADGTIGMLDKSIKEVDPNARVSESAVMTVRVVTDVVDDVNLADDHHALARPAGVKLDVVSSGLFGFDDAGEPFGKGSFID